MRSACFRMSTARGSTRPSRGLGLRGSGDEGGHDIAGVAVEVVSGSGVAGRGAGIGVAAGDLDVTKGRAGIRAAAMKRWRSECGDIRL